jgi:hypothetical protein
MREITFVLNEKAEKLAANYLATEGEILTTLMEMKRHAVFAEINYSGIWDYCHRHLKLSPAQSHYFRAVADASETVPELKNAVVAGEITLSEARRISPVIKPENHAHWISQVKTLPQLELDKAVTAVNPRAHVKERIKPVAKEVNELRAVVDDGTEKKLTELRDILSQKLQRPATLSDVIAWATEVCHEKHAPTRKAHRSFLRKSKPAKAPKPGRHQIPAAVKHEVINRIGWQCAHIGPDGSRCRQKRHLHFHHIVEVAHGGLNVASNLTLRCSAHHRLAHSSPPPHAIRQLAHGIDAERTIQM